VTDQLDTEANPAARDTKQVTVTVDGKRVTFPTDRVTGKDIKEEAGIPLDYSLYLRHHGDNEPISNQEEVELHEDQHFFSRPPSNVS
jgi:hypothetical protein